VTPFLAIFRQLAVKGDLEEQRLFLSNRTARDVICEKELRHYFGDRCHLLLSRDNAAGYESGRVTKDYLADRIGDLDQFFYLCGPPSFVEGLQASLDELGVDADRLVFER
jgi:ferredoxin-NADP reductase